MKIAGMLRVKNEARWIERAVGSLLPICHEVYVLDDHSDDGTPEILRGIPGVTVIDSPFTGLDESRDKNHLLAAVRRTGADWVVHIDGDEEVFAPDREKLRAWIGHTQTMTLSFQILYLWGDEKTIRTDGVYARMRRSSAFCLHGAGEFRSTSRNGNLHCSNIPANLAHRGYDTQIRLLHYGYMLREDRLRKYEWYNRVDPGNTAEDRYRHVVQGDIPEVPASARTKHAGPLTLQPLETILS